MDTYTVKDEEVRQETGAIISHPYARNGAGISAREGRHPMTQPTNLKLTNT